MKEIIELSKWKVIGSIIWILVFILVISFLATSAQYSGSNNNVPIFDMLVLFLSSYLFYLILFGGLFITYFIIGFVESVVNKPKS